MYARSIYALLLSGCAADATSTDTAPITNPDSSSVPAFVVPISIHGVELHDPNLFETVIHACSGVVIDPHWVVTSAHCWVDIMMPDTAVLDMHVGNTTFVATDVHFHPQAWPDGEENWKTVRPQTTQTVPAPSHDL